MAPNCKRLTVDHDHQYDIPQIKKMKLGSERQAILPSKLPGPLAPTNTKCKLKDRLVSHGKVVLNGAEKRPRRKIEISPPKVIRDAALVRVGPDGFSREMYLHCQNRQVSSFEPCKDSLPSQIQKEILFSKQSPGRLDPVSPSGCEVLSSRKNDADCRPLVEMISTDNQCRKMGFKVDEGAVTKSENDLRNKAGLGTAERKNLKVTWFDKFKLVTPANAKRMDEGALKASENDLRNKVGLSTAERRNIIVSRFDKFKPVTPVSEKRMEDREETGILCTSESNMERPKFRRQIAGGSSYGAKCHVGRMTCDYSRPKSSIQRKSSFITHSPEVECFDVAPLCGVQDAVKHKVNHVPSLTTYDSEGRKNEINSADKLDHLGIEVDKAKASEQNFVGRKSSTSSRKGGMVGLSDYSGINNSSYAFKDDTSNIYNQETRCEIKVLNLSSGPDNDYQVCQHRDEVRKVLDLYKETLERLRRERVMEPQGKGNAGMHIYVDAAMQLKEQNKWLNMQKCLGAVPGVEVGDQFHRRAELVIVGLHSKFLAGIDFKKIDGTLYATSIVASGRYGDKTDSSDVLVYVGEGGNPNSSSEKLEDQNLVRGNLALKNSIDKFPVRVIRSIQNMAALNLMQADKPKYYYDGLYFVRKCWSEREHRGNLVFKFRLERVQGQQELTGWNTQNASRKSNKASYGPVVVHDISKGKENMPIRVVNAIDCEKPPPFKYTTKMINQLQQCVISKPSVCDCLNGCTEDIACSCIIKNNREVSVNNCVSIFEKKPIFYECGPSCKCPPDCENRMTQHGIKLQLEIFKTITKQWGVRSRNFISEGRFICEYVGELLQYKQKEGRIDFDKSTFDSQGYPNLQSGSSSKGVDDAKNVNSGNVGRFIRHSCSPNVYAKCVLFDHEDKGRPHVMLFAAKNIPPKRELTFDYKLW